MIDQLGIAESSRPDSASRPAGIVLATGAIVLLAFMALHPTVHATIPLGLVAGMSAVAGINAVVHGALIANQGVILLGLLGLADCLGPRRTAVRAGIIAFAMGAIAFMGAALTNGFVVPAMIAEHGGGDVSFEELKALLGMTHHASVGLSDLGITAMSGAVLLLSIVMLRRGGSQSALGALGLACAALPVIGFASGHLHADVHGILAFAVLQAIWYLAIAVQLIRGRI